jgi:hypothetical protein
MTCSDSRTTSSWLAPRASAARRAAVARCQASNGSEGLGNWALSLIDNSIASSSWGLTAAAGYWLNPDRY